MVGVVGVVVSVISRNFKLGGSGNGQIFGRCKHAKSANLPLKHVKKRKDFTELRRGGGVISQLYGFLPPLFYTPP